jgi:hypothetical protein
MLITGERRLRPILGEYIDHYNTHRPHRPLEQGAPAERPNPRALGASIRVLRRDRLGGLIHEYAQVARGDRVSGTQTFLTSPDCWVRASNHGAATGRKRTRKK